MKALDDVVLIIKGTVEGRGGAGGVQYTQQVCCTVYEHWTDNGVGGMNRMGQQVEKAFGDRGHRAEQVLSSRNVIGDVRAFAIPSTETLKDIEGAVGLLLNRRAQELMFGTHGQPPSP